MAWPIGYVFGKPGWREDGSGSTSADVRRAFLDGEGRHHADDKKVDMHLAS